jgi:hypothetical protein
MIGVDDNFFALGGDSIRSIQVIARANQAGIPLSVKDLFHHQTIAELAAAAEAAGCLQESALTDDVLRQWADWLTTLGPEVCPLPVDFATASKAKTLATVAMCLDEDETSGLLENCSRIYRTRPAEVLLAALMHAVEGWTGQRSLFLDLDIPASDPGDDVGRSLAAGNVMFPARLCLGSAYGPAETSAAVKEQLRAVPNEGRGYALLAQSGDETITRRLQELPAAEVCFRYTQEPEHHQNGLRKSYLLEVVCRIDNGRLYADWTYNARVHRENTVEGLAAAFLVRLRELVEHCRSAEVGRVSAADFPEARLSHEDLEQLLSQIGSGGEDNLP